MNKLHVNKNRDLIADKKELDSILEKKCLSDEYLIESGRGRTRSEFAMAGEYAYGICMVIDDIAEHWLYRAINAETALQETQIKLLQHEIVKGVLTWWSYKCGHTVQEKYSEECPVCELRKKQDRERVLREALEKIANSSWLPAREIAREALKREGKPW